MPQDSWYLTADYTVKCQQGEWNGYAAFGAICILFFVIGIPGVQLYILYKNRRLLHVRDGMTHKEKQQQHIVQKEYGSIYEHYTEECYYYDILDLFRRLLLTGGLIMMGEESVAQVFLGIVICAMWLVDNPQEAIQVRMGQLYCHYFGCSPLVYPCFRNGTETICIYA